VSKEEWYQADPTGIRTGIGPGPHLAETLEKVAKDAEIYCSKVKRLMGGEAV